MIATKKKSFNTELDNLLAGINLPSDEEVREETGKVKRAEGLRSPKVREKIGRTLKSSAKYKEGIKNRDQSYKQSADYKDKRSQSMSEYWADPKNKEKHKKALQSLKDDPIRLAEYKKNYAKGNSKKYDDPKYWENYYKGISKRDADEEYHKRRIAASNAKLAIKVITPDGEFDSISDAARHYGMTSEGMRNRVNSDKYLDFYKTGNVVKKPQKKKK
jgi:hypothetical protein